MARQPHMVIQNLMGPIMRQYSFKHIQTISSLEKFGRLYKLLWGSLTCYQSCNARGPSLSILEKPTKHELNNIGTWLMQVDESIKK